MRLAGAAAGTAAPVGEEPLPGTANYFLGNDPAKWRAGVPTFARVRLSQVYPGVDLVYYGHQGQLEYDFVVAPGSSPKPIRLQFSGATRIKLDREGNLVLTASAGTTGTVAFRKPIVYQERNGERQPVSARFILLAGHSAGFSLGSYDHTKPLVIDPVLVYSTYLGGSVPGGSQYSGIGDEASAIAVDREGNAYVAGSTVSPNFPVTKGAFQNPKSFMDHWQVAFVAKLNPTGTALIYSTLLGGSYTDLNVYPRDYATAIAADGDGNAYVTGSTYSYNFPVTARAPQRVNHSLNQGGSSAAFITKLNATGTELVYSTYLGGNGNYQWGDGGAGIAIDGLRNAYVAGHTSSPDFPVTKGAFQTTYKEIGGGQDTYSAFVTKLNTNGTEFVYSTFLGGSTARLDQAYAVAVDSEGDAYVTGSASSTDFPVTPGAFQTKFEVLPGGIGGFGGITNAFVTKLNPAGSALLYSTFLGGSGSEFSDKEFINGPNDVGFAVAVDASGNAYIAGQTNSQNFPVTGEAPQAGSRACLDMDTWELPFNAFAAKLNPEGSALEYSTYLGGSGNAIATGIAVDRYGDAYVAGQTAPPGACTFPSYFPATPDAFQATNPGNYSNAFVTKLDRAGNGLIYSTYLGGSGTPVCCGAGDAANGIAVDRSGNAYVAGYTDSTNFPVTSGVLQKTNHAAASHQTNAFIAKMGLGAFTQVTTAVSLLSYVNPAAQGTPVNFQAGALWQVGPVGKWVPVGTVTFAIDGKVVATGAMNGQPPHYIDSTLTPGKHTVTASYEDPSGNFAASSASMTETVTAAANAAATPTFSPAPGAYHSAQSVTISDTTPGARIYYTTNGLPPTPASTRYKGPIPVSQTTTIQAAAVAAGYPQSAVASATYTIANK